MRFILSANTLSNFTNDITGVEMSMWVSWPQVEIVIASKNNFNIITKTIIKENKQSGLTEDMTSLIYPSHM